MSEMPPSELHILYAETKWEPVIRKWDHRPFDGSEKYHHDRIVKALREENAEKDKRIAELEDQLKEQAGYVLMPVDMTDEMAEMLAKEARCCGGIAETIYWKLLSMGVTHRHNASAEGV